MIILIVALIAISLFAGYNFAILLRTQSMYKKLLKSDSLIVALIGNAPPGSFHNYRDIAPLFGNYQNNIEMWENAQNTSLLKPAKTMGGLFAISIMLLTSLHAGWWSAFGLLGILIGFGMDASESQIKNVFKHAIEISNVMMKWHEADPASCENYCQVQKIRYHKLYQGVIAFYNGYVTTEPQLD